MERKKERYIFYPGFIFWFQARALCVDVWMCICVCVEMAMRVCVHAWAFVYVYVCVLDSKRACRARSCWPYLYHWFICEHTCTRSPRFCFCFILLWTYRYACTSWVYLGNVGSSASKRVHKIPVLFWQFTNLRRACLSVLHCSQGFIHMFLLYIYILTHNV